MKEDDSSYLGTCYKLSGKKGERKCRHLSYCNGLLENSLWQLGCFPLGSGGEKNGYLRPPSGATRSLRLKTCCWLKSVLNCFKSAFQFVSHFL